MATWIIGDAWQGIIIGSMTGTEEPIGTEEGNGNE